MSPALANGIAPKKLQRSDRFWFADGSLLVSLPPSVCRVHRSILARHSTRLASWVLDPTDPAALALSTTVGDSGSSLIVIPDDLAIDSRDFEALLAHLYHDSSLTPKSPFEHVAGVLRVASPRQLDLPPVFGLANDILETLFPGGPVPFTYSHHTGHLEEALELALQYDVSLETKKALLYSVATSTNFDPKGEHDPSGEEAHDAPDAGAPHPALSLRTIRICHRLLASLIADFTPVLFTVAAASHMACTDIIADRWMDDVISPALADGGVGRPLETLSRIAAWRWKEEGVCDECVESKKEEWAEEARSVWEKVGGWAEEAEKEFPRD
ncbi:hypothetical protein BC834DRAFT_966052 [Gloeopeniophorella convolvens]|nr:hypothetical protein BC834DRAFT_966052 [Gloeopeniophorella convolvens]